MAWLSSARSKLIPEAADMYMFLMVTMIILSYWINFDPRRCHQDGL